MYKGIPAYQGDIIHDFIVKLENPHYPQIARKAGRSGKVYCQVLIDEEGKVEAVIVNSTFDEACARESIEAIRRSKFKTYKEVTGKEGKYSLLIEYTFAMRIVK